MIAALDTPTTDEILADIGREVRADLLKTCRETVQYVSFGRVATRDLVQKYGVTHAQAEYILAMQCDRLCRQLRSL